MWRKYGVLFEVILYFIPHIQERKWNLKSLESSQTRRFLKRYSRQKLLKSIQTTDRIRVVYYWELLLQKNVLKEIGKVLLYQE